MSFSKNLYYIKHAMIWVVAAISLTIAMGAVSTLAETLRIEVNKASILKLTETPSTIIIGNPALADVTPQENNVLVLVGKASGRTNIIILDEYGDIMHNYDIAVQEEQSGNLTLFKAGKQWSYSCAPYCERVINPNDDVDAFTLNFGQVLAKSNQMLSAARDAASGVDSDIGGRYTSNPNGAGGSGAAGGQVVANNGGGSALNGGGAGFAGNARPVDQLQTFTILPPQ